MSGRTHGRPKGPKALKRGCPIGLVDRVWLGIMFTRRDKSPLELTIAKLITDESLIKVQDLEFPV
jgi:hypothetical protein